MKTYLKKAISMLLAFALCLSTFVGLGAIPAFAAGEQATVYMINFPRGGDVTFGQGWGHSALTYKNGWFATETDKNVLRVVGSYTGNIAYCIEPGPGMHTGDTYTSRDENYWDDFPANDQLSGRDINILVGRIIVYGYQGGVSQDWRTQTGTAQLSYALATQLLIWEVIVGERDADFNKVGTGGYNAILDSMPSSHPLYSEVMGYYASIESQVKTHTMLPSFFARSTGRAQEIELEWDGSKYTKTLTDTNNVLGNYTFSASASGFHFSVNGNKLTITADSAPRDAVTITANKNNSTRMGLVTWTDGYIGPSVSGQDMATYTQGVSDPIQGFLSLRVSYGSAKIVKKSEDGKVDGISFTITGNGLDRTVKTSSTGEIQIDNLVPGVYTVTELTSEKYEPQTSQQVTVQAGQVATVTFNNVLKRGDLTVTKTSEDGLVEGVRFHLTGTSLSGQKVDEYATTDSSGRATFKGILIGTGYTLEEADTAIRYVIPDSQTVNIEWNKVAAKAVENRLKKWRVTITKHDSEQYKPLPPTPVYSAKDGSNIAQGDATLAGAVYGIYKGETLLDSYTTDANGQFTTKYYPCGEDYTLREISPSEGYLLNDTVYPIGVSAGHVTIEYTDTAADVTEQVIKGDITIIKHTDNGDTQLETPEAGAEFTIYLKTAGSYDAAKETERDLLICDEHGFAQSKLLPYGVYIVHQTKGWEGRALLPDFEVYIAEDGKTYRYLANNATFESHIKVVKVDAESGKPIPYAGAGFQVYMPDGSLYTYKYTYPEPGVIDTFYTTAEGYLILPEPLEYGAGYSLVEVQAPFGYVLDSEPVYFDITADQASEEDGLTIITVTKKDMAQKGIIRIAKSGEVFASVIQTDDLYQPVYEVQGLPGAVYEIAAAEDIVTPDGTIHAKQGDIVDTVTTGPDGAGESKPLYLGCYKVVEKTAPAGMVLNTEPHNVELTYAGQEVEITETAASFVNERQKVVITLEKLLEQDEVFGIGSGNELAAVTFGLYAAEELTAADGSTIPQDGLVEIVSVSGNGIATVTSDLPLGSYYLLELSTDEHYLLSDTKYPVTFAYAGQETALVEIKANDGQSVTNELVRGRVQGLKKDEEGGALAGALIGLFPVTTTEFTIDTALVTATSAEDGSFAFENVPIQNWLVHEIASPTGYVLSDVTYPITVDEVGTVIEIEIVNRQIRGNVQLTKVDRDYPDNHLTGAVFEVYRDSNGNQELDEDDRRIGTMTETSLGVYEMKELSYGGHFVREVQAPDGFYLDENAYYFEITEYGQTVVVENEAGKGFINNPRVGSLKILKTSSDGRVSGFTFRVTGPNGYDQTFTTDQNGQILIEGLREGDYVIHEENDSASAGYVLPADKTVTVLDRVTVEVTMHNELRDTPKTGDARNPMLWIALMVGAGIAAIVCAVFGFHRSRRRRYGED